MKKKNALITGVSGQDGAYLAEFLLKKNYKVVGADRRSSRDNGWRLKFLNLRGKIILEDLDICEITNIIRLFNKYDFDEVYNLAAQSFVQSSFFHPIATTNVTALGALNLLEVIRDKKRKIKFYQASSSEMFGNSNSSNSSYLNEKSEFNPQSPYAISKVFAYHATRNYRNSYNMFTTNGILFNHESPLRGEEFITRKITKGFAKILGGGKGPITIGNIYAKRDWGFAGDYVEAMWKMMQQKKPDDFVIATGKTHSIKQFINYCVDILDLKAKWVGSGLNEKLIDLKNKRSLIQINKKYFRPAEVNYLRGNWQKAKKILKWKPKTNLKELVKLMLEEDIKFNNAR